jgi:hypothetical protein
MSDDPDPAGARVDLDALERVSGEARRAHPDPVLGVRAAPARDQA